MCAFRLQKKYSFHDIVEPTCEAYECGIPVDGDLIAGVGAFVVDVGFIGLVGGIGELTAHLILLAGIGTAN